MQSQTTNMAVVIATYTRKRAEAKAYIRYIQHRKGLDGKKITRELYGHEGVMERGQGYELIDNAEKGTVFFRIIINPDPATEDTHKDLSLPEITGKTMQTLQGGAAATCHTLPPPMLTIRHCTTSISWHW